MTQLTCSLKERQSEPANTRKFWANVVPQTLKEEKDMWKAEIRIVKYFHERFIVKMTWHATWRGNWNWQIASYLKHILALWVGVGQKPSRSHAGKRAGTRAQSSSTGNLKLLYEGPSQWRYEKEDTSKPGMTERSSWHGITCYSIIWKRQMKSKWWYAGGTANIPAICETEDIDQPFISTLRLNFQRLSWRRTF